jgi:hypothetical protein
MVPNRIAPRLSALTRRAAGELLPMVVYRMPQRSQFARARSQAAARSRNASPLAPLIVMLPVLPSTIPAKVPLS